MEIEFPGLRKESQERVLEVRLIDLGAGIGRQPSGDPSLLGDGHQVGTRFRSPDMGGVEGQCHHLDRIEELRAAGLKRHGVDGTGVRDSREDL